MQSTPRGIRNYNPGNIERGTTRWQGMSQVQSDPRFVSFCHPVWGIRAMARILITYQDTHKLRTVWGIISRWAPLPENDTTAYIASVNQQLGLEPGERIDVYDYHTMLELVRAIIRHENGPGPLPGGNWYGDVMLADGLALAGIMPGIQHGEAQPCA